MSRYVREEILNQPDDFVNYMMNDFLTKHGFKYENFKGQMVYRSGGGMIELPKFLTWNYVNGVVHIEAWVRVLWLPGVYGKENNMSGFYGAVLKDMYKKDVEQLIALLHQPLNQTNQPNQPIDPSNPQNPAFNQPGMPPQNGPIMVQGVDTSRYANFALAFGIAGLIFSWAWMGLVLDIIAIAYAMKGKSSAKKGRATAGMVCAIIGIVIVGFFFLCGFAVGLLGE